ncbi:MAG: hypothetical protein ACLR43_12345 [Faecalibacillus faecis]
MDNAISNSAGSIFVSGMSFFAATFGEGMISKLNMIDHYVILCHEEHLFQ